MHHSAGPKMYMYVCLNNGIHSKNTKRACKRYIGYLMGFCNVYFLMLDGGYMIIYYLIHFYMWNTYLFQVECYPSS